MNITSTDFRGLIGTKIGAIETQINCASEWIQSNATKYNERLLKFIDGETVEMDCFVTSMGVYDDRTMQDLLSGTAEVGQLWFDQLTGETHTTEEILEAIGADNATFAIKKAALDALAVKDDASSIITDFYQRVQSTQGQISSKTSGYVEYIHNVLRSPQDKAAKLQAILSNDIPISDDTNDNEVATYTGVNPFMAMLNAVDIDLKVNWSSVANAVQTLRTAARAYMRAVFKYVWIPLGKWISRKATNLANTFVNPMDLEYVSSYSDYSINQSYVQGSFNYPNFPLSYKKHVGEAMCVPMLGGTLYLTPQYDVDLDAMTINWTIKKHCYDRDSAKLIYDCLLSDPVSVTKEQLYSMISGRDLLTSLPEGYTERQAMEGLYYSEQLLYAGLMLSTNTDIDVIRESYFKNDNVAIAAFSQYASISDVPQTITNNTWLTESCYVKETAISAIETIILQILNFLSTDLSSRFFVPYFWTVGELPGAFNVKTDTSNYQAVANIFKAVLITAVVVATVVVGIKLKTRLKNAALTAQRAYEQAFYDNTIDNKQFTKLKRKARNLAFLSGTNFIDVVDSSNFTDMPKILGNDTYKAITGN